MNSVKAYAAQKSNKPFAPCLLPFGDCRYRYIGKTTIYSGGLILNL